MNTIRELKQQEKYNNMLKRKNKEIERLNNIINEAIEYIKSNEFIGKIRLSSENKQSINKLLGILQGSDKE